MTNTDKMRDEFEAHAAPMGFDLTRQYLAVPEPWAEYVNEQTGYFWAGYQAVTLKAIEQQAQLQTEAWLIEWVRNEVRHKRVFTLNAIGDYRDLYKDATVTELVRRSPVPTGGK